MHSFCIHTVPLPPPHVKIVVVVVIVTAVVVVVVVLTFMQGIYNYIPETNLASRVYSVAAVLYLQFVLHVMLLCP